MKNVQSSVESASIRTNHISSRGLAMIGATILAASAGTAMAQTAPQPRPATQTASAAGETEIGTRKRDAIEAPIQARPDAAPVVNRAPVAQPVIAPVAPVQLADTSEAEWNERARAAYAAVDLGSYRAFETQASFSERAKAVLDLPADLVGFQGDFDLAHASNALPQ